MFYHVRITQSSSKSNDETKVDLTEEQLQARYLIPYQQGEPIIINGKTVPVEDLERIRISKSDTSSEYLIQQIRAEDRRSSVLFVGGPSYEWRAAEKAEDVTDEFIKGPPGYMRGALQAPESNEGISVGQSQRVFVVHGHDHELRNDLEVFLREIGLEPIVLQRQPDEGLTVIEKFERYSDVGFVFILITGDDIAFPITQVQTPQNERDIEYRARQNVIFEFGYFVGKLGRSRVCCIYKEGVTLPSDISGLLYKKVTGSIESIGYSLIRELKQAGFKLNI